MLKKILGSLLAVCMLFSIGSSVFAEDVKDEYVEPIKLQADNLIASVDNDALMLDTMKNVIDYSVPLSVRESTVANASFVPNTKSKSSQNVVELEVNSTVQKIGEIVNAAGQTANMYVAAAATEVKEDWDVTSKHGIKAWAFIYWIDNPGADNELYAAEAMWDPQGNDVSGRKVSYGVSDLANFLWYDGPTVNYPTGNSAYYEDPSSYIGNVLRCEAKINVTNKGYVICNVVNSFLT